jgi:hypothetical protein
MKKILLLSAVVCMAFYACKKDDNPSNPTPTVTDTVATIDKVALAAAVKVGYAATTVKDTIPAASTSADAPVLDTRYDYRTYYAINNRYLVIRPKSLSGFVKGYYVTINGSGSYFKIDYTAASGLKKAGRTKTGAQGVREGDNSDSTIVLKLPANLIGDTFSIKYAAFDTLNRVSNSLTAIVSIIAASDTTGNSKLLGNYQLTGRKSNDGNWQPYGHDSTKYNFYCQDSHLYWGSLGNDQDLTLAYYVYNNNQTFSFAANNALTAHQMYEQKYLDMDNSSCSEYTYIVNSSYDDVYAGGYSYDASTKVLTIIYDYNGTGTNLYTDQYTVSEITASKIIIYQANNDDRIGARQDQLYINYYEYTKIVK